MNLKVLKSLFVIGTVIFIASQATKAAWTDAQTVSKNVFETGTLDLSTIPTTALFDTSTAPIYPGWSETKSITVSNSGTDPLTYTISAIKYSGDEELFNSPYFKLKIGTTEGGSEVYNGRMDSIVMTGREIAIVSSEILYFTASLDIDANDTLKNKKATINFIFSAV